MKAFKQNFKALKTIFCVFIFVEILGSKVTYSRFVPNRKPKKQSDIFIIVLYYYIWTGVLR